jgi:hypothetical protein
VAHAELPGEYRDGGSDDSEPDGDRERDGGKDRDFAGHARKGI